MEAKRPGCMCGAFCRDADGGAPDRDVPAAAACGKGVAVCKAGASELTALADVLLKFSGAKAAGAACPADLGSTTCV